jgi:hypothetical protein
MKLIMSVWTTLSFSFIFLVALGMYPFHGAREVTLAGLCVGLGSGVAWGVSVHGASRWNSVFNYIAAALTVLSVAYLTSDSFTGGCEKHEPVSLCSASSLAVSASEWIWSSISSIFAFISSIFVWIASGIVGLFHWLLSLVP